MTAKDIVLQHVGFIEKGASPFGEMLSSLQFLAFNSFREEAEILERRLKRLASKAIRDHLVDIQNTKFRSNAATEVVSRFIHAVQQPDASAVDEYGEFLEELRYVGLKADAAAIQKRGTTWLNDAIRGELDKIKESPFEDA